MSDIDPQLPFIQIHRSVGPKASSLAQVLGVTYQHARGSLECFWEALADRRILGGITELVLPEAEVRTRLRLAFGQPVEPDLIATLGFLESRPGGAYRIRGMSRYINAESARVKKQRKAPSRHSTPTQTPPESHPGVTRVAPDRAPGSHPGDTQVAPGSHPTEVRGERLEVRGKSRTTGAPPKKPAAARPSDELMADFKAVIGAAYHWHGAKDGVALAGLLKANTLEEVRSRWRKGLAATGWASCRTVAQLASKWNDLAGAPTPNTRSPVAAESVDWDNAQEGEIAL